jgi:hypothetical protein
MPVPVASTAYSNTRACVRHVHSTVVLYQRPISHLVSYEKAIADLRVLAPLTLTVGLILSDRGSFFYLKSAARSLQPENSAAAAGTAGKG